MADTTNTAEILITADASGVEAGLRQATTAAERAERQMSGGAGNSARAQSNLIQAIQRTTAQMEAGSRTGSRYFEIMARQRGVDPAILEPYLRQLRAIEEAQRRAAESAIDSSSTIENAFAALKGGAIVASIMAMIAPVVSAQREFDKLNASLVTATGSTDKAAVAFAALQSFAATTPYGVAEATEAFIKMRNMGLDPSERALRSYGNTAAAMGKSLEQMVEAVADAATGEFERLKEFGIKASKEGEKVTLTFKGASTTIKGDAAAIESYLMKIGEVDFAGAMIQRAATLDGAISQLADSWDSAMRTISSSGIGQAAQDGVVGLSASLNDLETILLAISEAADKQTEKLSAASTIHKALTTVFEAVSVLGVNVAYVFRQVGNEIGGLAAQATAVATGNFTQARIIGEQMKADAARDRAEVDRQTAAILGAVEKAKKAAASAPKKAPGEDALAQFRIERERERESAEAAKKREAAAKAAAEALKKEMALIAELSGYNADFAEKRERLNDAYAKGTITFSELGAAQAKLLSQQPAAKQAMSEQLKAQAESDKLYEQGIKTAEQYRDSLLEQLGAQRLSNEVIGLSAVATAELQAQRLWDAAALKEQAAAEQASLPGGQQLAEIYREQAAALRDLAQAKGEGGRKQDAADVSRKELEDLNKFLDPSRAQTFGEALREAFGSGGEALSKLMANLDGYGKREAEIAKHRETAERNRGQNGFDEVKYLKTITELGEREVKNRLQGYGDMAGAAKGFFSEGSKGYRTLQGAERAFRVMELASQMESLYTHLFVTTAKGTATVAGQAVETGAVVAGEAARNAAKVPGVYMAFMSALGPWGMAAAGVAIAAVLGGAFSGGGGKPLSQQRQETQGTGTVLGDSSAKSESIARSLQMIEDASFQGLGISNDMLGALRSIDSNLTGFSSLVVQTTGIKGTLGAGIDGGSSGFFAKLGNAIFGGKTTLQDSGFSLDSISFADIFKGKVNSFEYADTKKDGGWFSSSKYRTQIEGLGLEGNRQISMVLTSLYDAVLSAGGMLGIAGDDFTAKLDAFVVDIGKVSLRGLSGEEAEKEIQAVFSKVGDQLAAYSFEGLAKFQQTGEGHLETLTRIATGYQTVTVVADSLGMAFDAVGIGSIDARQRLIDLAGGLDEFKESAESFMSDFYTDKERADALRARIQPTLDKFGIQTGADDSMRQFRDVVKGLDLTTEAGAQAYAVLMQIAPAFKQIADVDSGLFEKRSELEIKLMDMLGDKSSALAASRAIELAGLDASLRPLQQRIYALEDEAAALELASRKRQVEVEILRLQGSATEALRLEREAELSAAGDSLKSILARKHALQDEAAALEVTNSLLDIQAKIYELTGNKAGAAAVLVQQQANALAALDPALRGATQQLWSLEAAAKAAEKVRNDASALLGGVDSAFSALERVVRREKSLVDERIAAEKKIVDKHQELSKSLRGTLDSMIEPTQLLGNRQGAQAQIQAALAIATASGTLPDAEDLKKALSIVSKESSELYATQQDYLRDFYTTQNDIAALADLTDNSLSIEEKSLKALEDEGKRLESIITSAQQQIDVLKGIDTKALSIEQAISALSLSISAAMQNPVVSATSAIGSTYQSALGRAPDAASLKYWQDRAAEGVSQNDILNAIARSPEANLKNMYEATLGRSADAAGLQFWLGQVDKGVSYADIQKALEQSQEKLRIPGFAAGGMFGGGLRIVGENGPELEATGPSRIWNASQTSDLLARLSSPSDNSAALVAELRALRAEVAELRKSNSQENYAIAKNTMNTADHLDAAVNGDVPLATKVIPA